MKCPNCGAPIERDDRFCAYCGDSLKKDAVPEREKQEIHIHYHQEVRQEAPKVEKVYVTREKFSGKNRVVALLLCLFLGCFGAHKFYMGRFWAGILYIFTYGLFGIGWLIDLVVLIFGNPVDQQGHRLKWH